MEQNKGRILVTGASGRLGTALLRRLSGEGASGIRLPDDAAVVSPAPREALDIGDQDRLRVRLDATKPRAVINCAAVTDVAGIETRDETRRRAWITNATGVDNLALLCARRRIPLIHVSTDFVFSGSMTERFAESAVVRPVCEYGRTKLAGEHALLRNATDAGDEWRWAIVRSAGLLSNSHDCFASKILRQLETHRRPVLVVSDTVSCLCHADWLAEQLARLLELLEQDATPSGVYHIASEDATTWHDIASALATATGHPGRVGPCERRELWDGVPRAAGTALDTSLWAAASRQRPPSWRRMLSQWLRQR